MFGKYKILLEKLMWRKILLQGFPELATRKENMFKGISLTLL